MSALTDKLARLRADLAAATPGPLKVHDESRWIVCLTSNGREIADFNGGGITEAQDQFNARAHVGAVNAAPTLIDIAEAAAKRPWWVRDEDAFVNAAGFICDGCAHPVAVGTERFAEAHADGCRYAASDAALDRAEAEAAR